MRAEPSDISTNGESDTENETHSLEYTYLSCEKEAKG